MNRACAALLVSLLVSGAGAEPMWVKNGLKFGQAEAINLGSGQCVAVTPAHVVLPAADRIRLTNVRGDAFIASLLATDSTKDVALLRVDVANSEVCGWFTAVSLGRFDEYQPGIISPGAWFDLVASPAGGLDRFDVALPKRLPAVTDTEFSVTEKQAPDSDDPGISSWSRTSEAPEGRFKRMPIQGNSGAILWVGGRESNHLTDNRYDGVKLQPDPKGMAAGMLLRVVREQAVLLSTPAIIEFIGQTLRPVEASRLWVDPAGAVISDRGRGQDMGAVRRLGPTLLVDLSFEFDLGDEDVEFHGLTVRRDTDDDPIHRFDPRPQFRIDRNEPLDVLIFVSQFRPKDGGDWRESGCKDYKWEHQLNSVGAKEAVMNCDLSHPVVARGIRITLRGVPGRWRSLQLRLIR